jgi:hypothetical protein
MGMIDKKLVDVTALKCFIGRGMTMRI